MSGDQPPPAGPRLERQVVIVNRRGLHARASAKLVQCAERFVARISVEREGLSASGTSIMGLMMLAATPGTQLRIVAEGPDASAAVDALARLVADGFGEADT